MQTGFKKVLLLTVATICGYFAMVILITLVQEGIFGGVGYYKSGWLTLLFAGVGTFLAAVGGGVASAAIARSKNYLPHFVICGLVVIETIWFATSQRSKDPVWFDLLASSSLLAGVLLGGYWFFSRRRLA